MDPCKVVVGGQLVEDEDDDEEEQGENPNGEWETLRQRRHLQGRTCNRESESEAVGDSEGTFSVLDDCCDGSTAVARPVRVRRSHFSVLDGSAVARRRALDPCDGVSVTVTQ
ncbi:hypothetical protein HN51_056561 [Arachis hypogaea]